MKKYSKLAAELAVTVLLVVISVWNGGIDTQEWILLGISAVNAWNVFFTPNIPGPNGAKYSKTFVAVGGAVLAALSTLVLGGLDASEVMQLVVVALGAAGVYGLKNEDNGVNLSEVGHLGTNKQGDVIGPFEE